MKGLILLLLLTTGCVGASGANPLEREGRQVWWQKNTYGLSQKDNPWEAFNQSKIIDEDDPWGSYRSPELFSPVFLRKVEVQRNREKRLLKFFKKMMYPKEL